MSINLFVYCGRKCGSSTLSNTFQTLQYNTLHVHSDQCYLDVYPEIVKSTDTKTVKDLILKQEDEIIYIVDSYRDPIERMISSLFQNLRWNLGDNYSQVDINFLIYHLYLDYKFEDYHPLDLEYPILKDIPFVNKYIHLINGKFNYIKLRFKDIDRWSEYLSEIIGKEITIQNSNISDEKEYYELYKEFKKQFVISREMFDFFITGDTFIKYNSLEEENEYIKRWSSKIRPNSYFETLLENMKFILAS